MLIGNRSQPLQEGAGSGPVCGIAFGMDRNSQARAGRLAGVFATIAGLAATPAAAHPHVFIDTSLTAVLNDSGQLTAIRLRWDYDDYISMMLVEDKSADTDLDGTISASEMAALNGFDMTWVDGFDGDTSLSQSDTPLLLEPGPQDWATGWAATDGGGHLWSEHTRRLVTPVDLADGPVSVVVYDFSDYTAYAFTGAVVEGVGSAGVSCRIGPPSGAEGGAEGDGFLATLGLFVFGSDDKAAGSGVPALVPDPAPGRVVAVLSCE